MQGKNTTYIPYHLRNKPINLVAPPPLEPGLTPIEELRREFIKVNPGIKHVEGVYYKALVSDGKDDPFGRRTQTMGMEKWLEFIGISLKGLEDRCAGRCRLPERQYLGGSPDLKEYIHRAERYYTQCREREVKVFDEQAARFIKIDEITSA